MAAAMDMETDVEEELMISKVPSMGMINEREVSLPLA
jgi:hypothetical protein